MVEATLLALGAVCYAAFISFTSMAVSVFFGYNDLLVLGHIIILIVFCGGGLGLVGWLKQSLGNPLVNVACSLTSLAIITILTKEGSVQLGQFSYEKVLQVLKMVLMGIAAVTLVSLIIKPTSARTALRKDLVQITDLLEVVLTTITRSFLAGTEVDLKAAAYIQVSNQNRDTFNSVIKNLKEAQYEHYLLGTEREYKIQSRLTKCVERLSQDLVGLRSAAATQFALISHGGGTTPVATRLEAASPFQSPDLSAVTDRVMSGLTSISEEPESPMFLDVNGRDGQAQPFLPSPNSIPTATMPADIFTLFIKELGPSMKSLAYTLQEILRELQFEPGSEEDITVNRTFRSSLVAAKNLFSNARKEALESLYKHRTLAKTWSAEVAADYEEVAASCGHFSSSLQDFADDVILYLDILEEWQEEIDTKPRKRSWNWLRFWRKFRKGKSKMNGKCNVSYLVVFVNKPLRCTFSVPARPECSAAHVDSDAKSQEGPADCFRS